MKKVKWCWDYEVYVPFCPFCNEPAYEKDHCVFCGKEYKWVNKSKARTVTVEDYTIVQASNNHIQVYKGERMVMHVPCSKKMSKRKLELRLCFYKGFFDALHEYQPTGKTITFPKFTYKGADNEQR